MTIQLTEIIDDDVFFQPVSAGHKLTEGIIWHPGRSELIFSCMAQGKVFSWSEVNGTSVIKSPSNITNGNFIDREGRLVSCEHATSHLVRMSDDGRYLEILASHYDGKELNSPNDVIVDSKGRIWFTDPGYGRTSPAAGVARDLQQDKKAVYRLDPDGTLTRVADDFEQPNGLCMEPGEKTLLVNDTPRDHIKRFTVEADGSLSGGEVIAEILGDGVGKPDGLKVDEEGRIYCTGPGGIHVLTPEGEAIGVIRTPEQCRNFCFGGEDLSDLFLATSTTIYRAKTRTRGIQFFA